MGIINTPKTTPGGSNTDIQYNNGTAFSGDDRLKYITGANNGLTITAAASGTSPSIAANATSDANVNIGFLPLGTGSLISTAGGTTGVPAQFQGAGTTHTGDLLRLNQNSGGNLVMKWATVSNAVNGVIFTTAATGGTPSIAGSGTDSNVGLTLLTKGTGNIIAQNSSNNGIVFIAQGNSTSQTSDFIRCRQTSGGNFIHRISTVASATNGIQLTGTATGGSPAVVAQGTDTNISLSLSSAGTGSVQSVVSGMTAILPSTIFTATASATVANTASATTIIGSGVGTTTLAANYLIAGRTIRLSLKGIYSTKTLTAGTLQFTIKFGSTTIAQSSAFTTTDNQTNQYFDISVDITCRTTGVSGTVFAQGRALVDTALVPSVPAMTNTTTTTIDTTSTQVIDCTATWGTADTGNTITCTNVSIESIN